LSKQALNSTWPGWAGNITSRETKPFLVGY
jgi:hypothetical protein